MNLSPARDLSEAEMRERLARDHDGEAARCRALASYGGCYVHLYELANIHESRARQLRKGSPKP